MQVNVVSHIFKGREAFKAATTRVNVGIDTYTAAVVDLSCVLGMELITQTQGIQISVDDLSNQFGTFMTSYESHFHVVEAALQTRNDTPDSRPSERFFVPYAKNPLFTGRHSYLELIRTQ